MYRRILATLDLTDTDESMMRHLISIARAFNSEIILIRVIHSHLRDEMKISTQMANDYLESISKRLKAEGLTSKSLVEYGEPDKVIIEKAEEVGADLIIIGTHGHKGFLDFLFGSVAAKVRHATAIPVLLIKRTVT